MNSDSISGLTAIVNSSLNNHSKGFDDPEGYLDLIVKL